MGQHDEGKGDAMTYETAMRILDRIREGWSYPAKIVDEALRMTGDLRENTDGVLSEKH